MSASESLYRRRVRARAARAHAARRVTPTPATWQVLDAPDGSAYLRALRDAHQAWHDGLKEALPCVSAGAMCKTSTIEFSPDYDRLTPLRLLTRAIWGFEDAHTPCPLMMVFIDGKSFYLEQIELAILGLVQA